MKLTCLIILTLAVMASGLTTRIDNKIVDTKHLVVKQKFILDILRHVHQPLQIVEYLGEGKTFVDGEMYYINYQKFMDFVDIYKTKMLPRGEVFSIMNKRHLKEVKGLFNLFYFSKDWVTLKKNIIWARMHVNEDMFVFALTACVIHRDDMVGVMLPTPYEINPFKFFNSEVITDGIKFKLQNKMVDDMMTHIIYRNKTHYHKDHMLNRDDKLSYFTEDIGLNTYYYFFQLDNGFWLGDGKDYDMDLVHRGEKYFYIHQQLLARYYMERLTNGLGEIYEFDWRHPIKTGYFSNLRYHNGLVYPMRHNNFVVRTNTKRDVLIEKVLDYERRLRDIIDRGYIVIDNKRFDLRDPKAIDLLGKLLVGGIKTEDVKFYRYVEMFSRILLSGSFHTKDDYKIVPGVLEHFETSLRDPVFFMLYKRIVRFYFDFKHHLKPYTKTDLMFNGVRIDNIQVGKLVTYFDTFDTDISNIIDIKKMYKNDHLDTMYDMHKDHDYTINNIHKDKWVRDDTVNDMHKDKWVHDDAMVDMRKDLRDTTWKWLIKARQIRLNHDLVTMNIDVTSDKDQKVVIRTFLLPKYDEFGDILKLKDNRENMVKIDKFVYDLKVGRNTIRRTSRDFYYTIPDATPYLELYKRVMTTTVADKSFGMDLKDKYCGFPDRLLLPKGRIGGFEMRMLVFITPFTGTFDKVTDKVMCGKFDTKIFDDLPYGYPFDRKINCDHTFMVDNMMMKDVVIFHRDDDVRMNHVI